jgi:hypothetical protein
MSIHAGLVVRDRRESAQRDAVPAHLFSIMYPMAWR